MNIKTVCYFFITLVLFSCESRGSFVNNSHPITSGNGIRKLYNESKYFVAPCREENITVASRINYFINIAMSKGDRAAYDSVKYFYTCYKKEYLLTAFYIKFSNKFDYSTASLDVYFMMSNFFQKKYMKSLSDPASKKIALYYLCKSYREDPNSALILGILKRVFKDGWQKSVLHNFLNINTKVDTLKLVQIGSI